MQNATQSVSNIPQEKSVNLGRIYLRKKKIKKENKNLRICQFYTNSFNTHCRYTLSDTTFATLTLCCTSHSAQNTLTPQRDCVGRLQATHTVPPPPMMNYICSTCTHILLHIRYTIAGIRRIIGCASRLRRMRSARFKCWC